MSSHGKENCYQLLGVDQNATQVEIKRAYRRGVRATHPDTGQGPPDVAQFRRIQRAYEVLADPAQRRRYDMTLGLGVHAGRARFYRRDYSRLFDTLFSKLHFALQTSFRPPERPKAEPQRAKKEKVRIPTVRRKAG
ncbi:MAG: J domain-containing protein [Planctomycetota bacterium]